MLHTYEDLQNKRIKQLNQAIDVGLEQLSTGNKISAKNSYDQLKKKINKIVKEPKCSLVITYLLKRNRSRSLI